MCVAGGKGSALAYSFMGQRTQAAQAFAERHGGMFARKAMNATGGASPAMATGPSPSYPMKRGQS